MYGLKLNQLKLFIFHVLISINRMIIWLCTHQRSAIDALLILLIQESFFGNIYFFDLQFSIRFAGIDMFKSGESCRFIFSMMEVLVYFAIVAMGRCLVGCIIIIFRVKWICFYCKLESVYVNEFDYYFLFSNLFYKFFFEHCRLRMILFAWNELKHDKW